MNTTLKTSFIAKFENKELLFACENKAINHVNYLCKMAGGVVWPWKKVTESIHKFTEKMYNNPAQYGVLTS